jgi:hypothetical protein
VRLFRRRPPIEVNVDPVQLVALHFLLRFGSAPLDPLYNEVSSTRPVDREVFTAAMADLAAQDVLDYRFDPASGTTSLVITPLGDRLRGRLPATSKSRIAYYL